LEKPRAKKAKNEWCTTFLFDNTYLSEPRMIFLSAIQACVLLAYPTHGCCYNNASDTLCVPFGLIHITCSWGYRSYVWTPIW
jgi:hypothetical protein